MPESFSKSSGTPVPPQIRPVFRYSILIGFVLIGAFLTEFELFRFGKISGLAFGMAVAATIAIYSVISQLLRQAARKRGAQLTTEEQLSLNHRALATLLRQKQINTVLLCMFGLGTLAVLTNVIHTGQAPVVLLVPAALLACGIWYRRALNRAIDKLEQKIQIDTIRCQ